MYKYFYDLAVSNGEEDNKAACIAGCCVAIHEYGCGYGDLVHKRIKEILSDEHNKFATGVIEELNKESDGIRVPRNMGPPPRSNGSQQPRRRWQENGRHAIPEWPGRRPTNNRNRKRRRGRGNVNRPESNQMGGMGSKRRRTSTRPPEIQSKPKR